MRIAWFLCRVDGMPNPPASLGKVTISQLIVWQLLCCSEPPQRKFSTQFVNVVANFLRKKHGLHYVGRD